MDARDSCEDTMRSPSLVVRGLFVAAAICVLFSGATWWLRQRAYANATPMGNASPLVYNGPAPVSRQLAQTLSSYHASDRERALFKRFTAAEEKHDTPVMRALIRTMARQYENAGVHDMAVELNKAALEVGKSTGRRMDAAVSLQDISDIYQKAGKLDLAVDYGRQAAAEYERLDARRELDQMLRRLTADYRGMGRYEEAKATLAKAEKVVASMHKQINAKARALAKQMHPQSGKPDDKKSIASGNAGQNSGKNNNTRQNDEQDDVTGGDAT